MDADLVFKPNEQMVLDVAREVRAEIMVDEDEQQETATEGDGVKRIRVPCKVRARLRSGEFSIDDTEWQGENLLTANSVSWTWFVTPKRLGEHQLTLEVQPVLHAGEGTTLRESRTVTVVDSSLGARLLRWLTLTTEVLRSFQGLLLAITAVLVAAAGALASMWWRKR